MDNTEAVAYWEQHGCVPSPEHQAALLTQIMQQNAELSAQVAELRMQLATKATRRQRTAPKLTIVERDPTSHETKAIDAHVVAVVSQLAALPDLAGLDRTQIYQVVEANRAGIGASKIYLSLGWGSKKHTTIVKPVLAALSKLAATPQQRSKTTKQRSNAVAKQQREAAMQ